jgi:uncharacterized protein YjfI (DUF2170 family)
MYHGITNEEIICLHSIVNDKLIRLEKAFETKLLVKLSKDNVLKKIPLSDTRIEKLKNEDFYVLLKSLHTKTSSIVELLKEIDEYKFLIEELK